MQNIYLGSAQTNLNELLNAKSLPLRNNQTKANAGTMNVELIKFVEKPSFIDYLRSGWQINLHVAIDFTASNGEPTIPSSLHFLGGPNSYE